MGGSGRGQMMQSRGVVFLCVCKEGSRKDQSVSCGEGKGSERT